MDHSEQMLALPEMLKHVAALHPSNTAIVFGDRKVDYAALDSASDSFAGALFANGIAKGDRVGLYCVNSDAFAVAYFGILKAGATVVPINLLLNPKEIAFILNDSQAKALCYCDLLGQAVSAMPETPSAALRICIGQKKVAETDHLFEAFLKQGLPAPAVSFDVKNDLAAIIYTSGTTGRPKGAMLTHRNLSSNVRSVIMALGLKPGEETFLVVLPMFHAFAATACMLTPLLSGCTIVPLPRFEPEAVARSIKQHGVTHFLGVPSMFNLLLRLPDEFTELFSSLKYAISGGAAMPVEIMRRFEERFGKFVYEGDGPTECSPVTCVNPIGGERKPGTVGLPVPDVQMKIMDENGNELPHGQIGEICVRGPNVMKGYWNLPDETKQSFFGEWFRTGDLGAEDEDGYFSIVDRKKDMIIVNGMNVYPRIVEELLYRHPAVREAAVVGEPDELHGEIPVAYISLKDNASVASAEIRAFCRDSLGRHEVPRKVFVIQDLPKNAAGKIMKRELRKHGELERGIDSRQPEKA